jgi:Nup53/35/40-type RNA recognition motif
MHDGDQAQLHQDEGNVDRYCHLDGNVYSLAPSPNKSASSLRLTGRSENWVRIFGFPAFAEQHVLKLFSSFGSILEHKVSSCQKRITGCFYCMKLTICSLRLMATGSSFITIRLKLLEKHLAGMGKFKILQRKMVSVSVEIFRLQLSLAQQRYVTRFIPLTLI